MTTPNLQLIEPPDFAIPVVAAAMRETFRVLDSMGTGWILVLSSSTTAPPVAPAQGATYLVPEGATGAWLGHAKHIAIYTPVGWIFRPPRFGWIAVVADQNLPYGQVLEYIAPAWVPWILPAGQISLLTTGDFASTNLQTLLLEINLRFVADEEVIADHESRIVTLEDAGGGGGGGGGLYSWAMDIPTQSALGFSSTYGVGASTFTDTDAGVRVVLPTNGAPMMAAPTPPYTLTYMLMHVLAYNDQTTGVGWAENAGGKSQVMYWDVGAYGLGSIAVQNNNAYNSFNSTQTNTGQRLPQYGWVWLRLTDDGTNVAFQYSLDAATWQTVYTVAKASGFLGSSGYANICMSPNGSGTTILVSSFAQA